MGLTAGGVIRTRRTLWSSARRDAGIAVVAVGLDLLLFTQLSDAADQTGWVTRDVPAAVIIGAGLLAIAPLSLRRRAPFAVCLAVAVHSALVCLLLGSRPLISLLVALYTAAVWSGRRRAFSCLISVLAVHALAVGYEASFSGPGLSGFAVAAVASVYGLLDVATWAAGRWGASAAARTQARDLEASRVALATEAVEAERLRIARELHDIVAHAVTVMVLQSAGARRMVIKDPALAAESMQAVETAGKQAIAELRRLLEVLRAGVAGPDEASDGARELSRLTQLEPLLDEVRSTGLDVRTELVGRARELDSSVDLAAYRVIQEALTNVNKHAGTAAVAKVSLRWDQTALVVEVTDDGPHQVLVEHGASGFGLVGLAERVKLVGGHLETGALPDGGYRVRAVLPTTEGDPPAFQPQSSAAIR